MPTATPTGIPIATPTNVPQPITVVGTCPSQAVTPRNSATPAATATPRPSGQFSVSQFVVLSCTSTVLNTGVQSLDGGGSIGANDLRAKGSTAEVRIGPNARISGDIIGNRLQLQSLASVQNVFYNSLSNTKLKPATIGGSQSHPLSLPLVNFPAFPTFTPGTDDVTISAGTAASLSPGSYRNIKVLSGASLHLSGGVYNIVNLTVMTNAQALAFGPSTIMVEGKVTTSKSSSLGAAADSGLAARDVVFYVAGINSRTGKPFPGSTALVNLGPNTHTIANLYAPAGKIQIGSNSQATGAFIANQVTVLNGTQLQLDSAF